MSVRGAVESAESPNRAVSKAISYGGQTVVVRNIRKACAVCSCVAPTLSGVH